MKHRLIDIDLYDEHEGFSINAIYHVANMILQGTAQFIRKSRHGNMHVLQDRARENCFDCDARQKFTEQLQQELIYAGSTPWVTATLRNLFSLFEVSE